MKVIVQGYVGHSGTLSPAEAGHIVFGFARDLRKIEPLKILALSPRHCTRSRAFFGATSSHAAYSGGPG